MLHPLNIASVGQCHQERSLPQRRMEVPMGLEGVCFELSVSCPKCGQPVAVNRLAERVACSGCGRSIGLPAAFWNSVMEDAIPESLRMDADEGVNATMIGCGAGLNAQVMYGHQAARCPSPSCKKHFPGEDLAACIGSGGGTLRCGSCGESSMARVPPGWFDSIHPMARLVVGEARGDGGEDGGASEAIPFHCYHCGASLSLDGASRTVKCRYCDNPLTVPDEIWARISPVSVKRRWYLVMETGRGAGLLPGSVDTFTAVAATRGGEMVAIYHADEDGDAGHPCRILRSDRQGVLRWIQEGVEFDGYAKLLISPGDGLVCIFDDESRFLRFVDADTGEPVCTVGPTGDRDEDESVMVLSSCQVVCATDGSILHYREGRDLRRFDRAGTRLPLWPGSKSGGFLKGLLKSAGGGNWGAPEFGALSGRPARLPAQTQLRIGWNGLLYVLSEDCSSMAVLDGEGRLVSNAPTGMQGTVEELHDFGIDSEGVVHILFEHSLALRDTNYPHLGRIHPDGRYELAAGPHSTNPDVFLGEYSDRLAVSPDGHCLVCSDFSDMRRISPSGEVVWRSPGTAGNEADQLEDLERNRRGKKLSDDRGL
jgi:DNA-directed RNA polymerase subunit RPC12/RpoP